MNHTPRRAPARESLAVAAAAAASTHPAAVAVEVAPHCLEPSSELPVEPSLTTPAQIEAFKRKVNNGFAFFIYRLNIVSSQCFLFF